MTDASLVALGLDLRAGARWRLRVPSGNGEVFGPEPFAPGQGFTLQADDVRWRGILLSAETDPDGGGVNLEIEVADCTPVSYGP